MECGEFLCPQGSWHPPVGGQIRGTQHPPWHFTSYQVGKVDSRFSQVGLPPAGGGLLSENPDL